MLRIISNYNYARYSPHYIAVPSDTIDLLAVGVKYWNKQGGKCLCEEQDKEQLFSFLGILGSEWRKSCAGHLDPSLFQYFTPTASMSNPSTSSFREHGRNKNSKITSHAPAILVSTKKRGNYSTGFYRIAEDWCALISPGGFRL